MKFFQIKRRRKKGKERYREEEGQEGRREGGQTALFPETHVLKLAMSLQCRNFFRKIKVAHRNRASMGSEAEDRRCLLDAGALVRRAPGLFQASVLTIVWNDGPGHGRRIDAPGHPEDAQPTKVLPSLLPRQEFGEIGENNGQSSADTAQRKTPECENQAAQSKGSQQEPSGLDPTVRLRGETSK